MDKLRIFQLIIERIAHGQAILFNAAKTAHEASIHEENIADNKYDTLGLEASYVAQGQANRAQEIKLALESYKKLTLQSFDEEATISTCRFRDCRHRSEPGCAVVAQVQQGTITAERYEIYLEILDEVEADEAETRS